MTQTVKFTKMRDVKTPSYGTPGSAGIDFYIPNDYRTLYLAPGEDALIPSGIRVNLPEGHALIGMNKSGLASSFGAQARAGRTPSKSALAAPIHVGAQVIDEDYQGEIHLGVCNVGTAEIKLEPGQKLVQFLLVRVPHANLVEVPESELFEKVSTRGEGGFTSTGLN